MNRLCTACQAVEAHTPEEADRLFGRRKTTSGMVAWRARCRECRREDAREYRGNKQARRIAWALYLARL